ncbi:MAG TPA: hypothetical protein VFI42_18800 [Thermomicrobiaceae bacterium]|nr:hypothetical protein [Thermomicrobiaceae bacterium]
MARRIVLTLIGALVMALMVSQPALAAISENTINPTVTMSRGGHRLTVTGPIACTAGEILTIRITVTQNSPNAWGEGRTRLRCSGSLQQWTVQVSARGFTTFGEGVGQACAFGMTRDRAKVTETRQWCAVNGVSFVSIQ